MPSGTDAFRHYNVGDWAPYGLAVANAGTHTKSQNSAIRELVELIGRNLCAIMWTTDANLRTPPSINVLIKIHKLCTRARSLLASRAVPPGTQNMETAHAVPSWEAFNAFPCPYFKVRNSWLKGYAQYMLIALTDAMQHQENARPLEISTAFSGQVGQYVQRIYVQMAVELLRVPLADAQKPDFTLTDAQLSAYNPSAWFTSTEMIDTVPDELLRPTEDDLRVLTDGIPYPMLPELPTYPAGVLSGAAGATGAGAAVPSDVFAPPPGA